MFRHGKNSNPPSFREKYGYVPKFNIQGKKQNWCDEHDYFTEYALKKRIKKYDGDKYKKE